MLFYSKDFFKVVWRKISQANKRIKLLVLASILFIFFLVSVPFLRKGINQLADHYPEIRKIRTVLKISDIFFLPLSFSSHELPVLNIYVDQEELNSLYQTLPRAFSGVLGLSEENRKWLNTKIVFENKEYGAKIRLRGEGTIHWRDSKKSFKIKLKKDQKILEMKAFHLVIPQDRGFLGEQTSNYLASKLNLQVPKSDFIVFKINNVNQGIYFFFEDWQEDFLLRNNLPLSSLFGEDERETGMEKSVFESFSFWKKYIEGEDSQAGEEELKALLECTKSGCSEEQLGQIVDIENLLNWHIHSLIMSSTHQNSNGNIRLYFNPEKKKLQFIPWDVMEEITDFEKVIHTLNPQHHPVVNLIYEDKNLKDKRDQKLREILKNEALLNELEKYYDHLWQKTKIAFYQDHNKFLTNFEVWQHVKKEKARIKKQIVILKKLADLL